MFDDLDLADIHKQTNPYSLVDKTDKERDRNRNRDKERIKMRISNYQ